MNQLDLKPETALAQKKIQGMMLLCFENERPLRGMIGYLDWRFNGHFSKLIQEQVLTGSLGETTYIPLLWNNETYSFLVVGAGSLPEHGHRPGFSRELFSLACTKLKTLNLDHIGVSAIDWDLAASLSTLNTIPAVMEGPNLWILN
jgi:hypothetical protein